MAVCDTCGNDYDKSFQVIHQGRTYSFDCFECAIHSLAPRCVRCRCAIIGHGTEVRGACYCGASCAHLEGIAAVKDRA